MCCYNIIYTSSAKLEHNLRCEPGVRAFNIRLTVFGISCIAPKLSSPQDNILKACEIMMMPKAAKGAMFVVIMGFCAMYVSWQVQKEMVLDPTTWAAKHWL